MLALERVEIAEALPHLEQPGDHELGDRERGDAGRVRHDDGIGQAAVVQVVDTGADRLDPTQVRRQLVDALREVEREHDLRLLPEGAALVGELVDALRVADVLPELPHVGEDVHLDVGHHSLEPGDEFVDPLARVGEDHGSGELRVGHGRQNTERAVRRCPASAFAGSGAFLAGAPDDGRRHRRVGRRRRGSRIVSTRNPARERSVNVSLEAPRSTR